MHDAGLEEESTQAKNFRRMRKQVRIFVGLCGWHAVAAVLREIYEEENEDL